MRLHPHFPRPRAQQWLALWIPLLSLAVHSAETVVAPNNLENSDAPFGSGLLRSANYQQQTVYGAAHFPEGVALWITELRYRPDFLFGNAFTTTVANIRFNLSTTPRNPDGLSTTFAVNRGSDDTIVFSGALSIFSQFLGPANGPKQFDIVIPLTTPFLYNPAAGNLLVEVRNFSGAPAASLLSGQNSTGDNASRLVGSIGSGGGVSTECDAIQIVYTPTNQPPVPPQPVVLNRGPYLQSGTTSNIIVRWRTSIRTNSVVLFGRTDTALAWGVTNVEKTNEHMVTLTNLAPDTKYFYAIGASETNLAGGPDHFFITASVTNRPTRIWAVGDSGCANQPRVGSVQDPFGMRDAYYSHSSDRYTDLFLMLGDNAYGAFGGPPDGSDESYSTNVFGVFPGILRQTAFWSTIGNHDAVNAPTYFNIFSFPQNGEAGGVPSGTELYYSFDYANIHFVCLDSEMSSREPNGAMLTWLEQDLAANTKDWVIAFWHSPPYTWGSHDSDSLADSAGRLVDMRENIVPVLESHGVDLVLGGHSHNYERSFLLDGHYGYSSSLLPQMIKDGGSGREMDSGAYLKSTLGPGENEGAVYVVCGSSGWVLGNAVGNRYLKHPAMFIGWDRVGSMVIDVDNNRMDVKFLTNLGAIDDYFTILKGVGPEPLRIKTTRISGANVTLQFKTIAGQSYRVESAPRLAPGEWQPASGTILATGATTKWSGQAPAETRFFRIALVPTP